MDTIWLAEAWTQIYRYRQGTGKIKTISREKSFCKTSFQLVTRSHSKFSHTHTQLANSNFEAELILRWLLLRGTHLQKWVISLFVPSPILTSEYVITLHASMSCIYAIVFFAGLSTFLVDQASSEINNRTSIYTQLVPRKLVADCNTHVE